MNENRINFAAVWVPDGRLFAVGGNSGVNCPTGKVEMLSCCNWETEPTALGDWSFVGPLPKARQSHAAAYLGDKLIVAGGTGECGVEVFTLPTPQFPNGQWTSVFPLPEPMPLLALIPAENVLIGISRFFSFAQFARQLIDVSCGPKIGRNSNNRIYFFTFPVPGCGLGVYIFPEVSSSALCVSKDG